jgi:hypothetical protein
MIPVSTCHEDGFETQLLPIYVASCLDSVFSTRSFSIIIRHQFTRTAVAFFHIVQSIKPRWPLLQGNKPYDTLPCRLISSSSSAFGMKPATGPTNFFGQPQQQTGQQQPNLFSGFGQNQQQNQPQQSSTTGGLFGSATQSQPTAGLFGSTQPQPGGSLFGNTQQQQQQQQQQQSGLFGSSTTATSNPLQPQATLPASAFGTSTTTGTGGFGGNTLFGNKQPQQQQQQQWP